MADKITAEFLALDDVVGGDIYFGLAESYQIRYLAAEIKAFKNSYPGLRYHITSGDTEQVTEKLDKGIIDFAVLAEKQVIGVDDLAGLPLFCSEQGWSKDIPKWCGNRMDELHLEGSVRTAGLCFAHPNLHPYSLSSLWRSLRSLLSFPFDPDNDI